jgi:hypothetical protein
MGVVFLTKQPLSLIIENDLAEQVGVLFSDSL